MSVVTTLLDFIRSLLFSGEERAEFEADPEGYLAARELDDITAQEVSDAFCLVYDDLPVNVASQVGSFARSTSTGSGRITTNQHAEVSTPHLPPAKAHEGETELEATIRQISYITNNYSVTEVDDRDTVLDNSVNQQIFADGDVTQTFDNDPVIASGDGAVAAGDDIDGPVVTGDHNLVGDGNVVATGGGVAAGDDIEDAQLITGENSGVAANQSDVDDVVLGDGNRVAQDSTAVAFGEGDASQANFRDVTVDDGSALSLSGDAYGLNDESVDNSIHDSFNPDESFNTETQDNDTNITDREIEVEDNEGDVDIDIDA